MKLLWVKMTMDKTFSCSKRKAKSTEIPAPTSRSPQELRQTSGFHSPLPPHLGCGNVLS